MRIVLIGVILLKIMRFIAGTCVLESEFGFILNCNIKKSGLFRVRNLGGLKAHFGLGFSLGDELGFSESLGNLEGNRKRTLNYKTGFSNKVGIISPNNDYSTLSPLKSNRVGNFNHNATSMTEVAFLPLGVPTFRPIPKNTNNLIKRSDVFFVEGVSYNETSTFNDLPEKGSGQTIVKTPIREINTDNTLIKGQHKNNGLNKSSTSVRSKDSQFESHKLTDKNNAGDNKFGNITPSKIGTVPYKTSITNNSLDNNFNHMTKVMVVMNAPKEYYPTGYDKNYDDNFKSKVELPPTNFICADQKYFPGLYANTDLGCMVFHVCAITDGGIVMKSFLCPESTLFDQSVLKCNWWFYVDCSNITYDSNIPISKSYQLMKSISYLSNFTKIQT